MENSRHDRRETQRRVSRRFVARLRTCPQVCSTHGAVFSPGRCAGGGLGLKGEIRYISRLTAPAL